ncbi:bis(5'-nucleosyl)-tetraphosphatase (symmetrical) YqeK [Thermoactinomyces mirandus]|uniref:bis(5'-nucleosyl)-tetraphosphatase (symmetrical) n=1 Tax=Thermoactinomyces mirandus TaxID=2756294 RepID=A0A7W1XPF3_9BACL|nr:bis(5'-nucleosyl)-tetraphosphatase (symmetrical) YqeK [Thermoactinomyces mirandus]MBA4600794.1 bis(5'-nucleosyl)-tetraphosphatase (symmetrical) YqeK [Thermoactinomyces mirandus]
MDLEFLKQATKKELPRSRWEHTLRVAETAIGLAKREGVDPCKTEIAAILHDYCKSWSEQDLVHWIKQKHLPQEFLEYNKELWHAPAGAAVACEKFGIRDEMILNAIRYHTTGRPAMSKLEKIIFLADYIEPGRRFPEVGEVRRIAEKHLDLAVLKALDNTIIFLVNRSQKIYPLTLDARNDLLDRVTQKNSREESI